MRGSIQIGADLHQQVVHCVVNCKKMKDFLQYLAMVICDFIECGFPLQYLSIFGACAFGELGLCMIVTIIS